MRARLRTALASLRRADGFTIIETTVAALILSVGVLGTFTLVNNANSSEAGTRARESAVSLARELLEDARSLPYASIDASTASSLQPVLAAMPSVGGSPVTRRGISFTWTASACVIDDGKDGYGDETGLGNMCTAHSPSTPPDVQPNDFKRVTVTVTWTDRTGSARSLTQAIVVNSNGANVGLPVQSLKMDSPTDANGGTDPTSAVIAATSTTVSPCAAGYACFTAKSIGANKIVFSVNGVDQPPSAVTPDATACPTTIVSPSGDPSFPCSTWHLAWSVGALSDGDYQVGARAVDTTNVAGAALILNVKIARGNMSAPCGLGSTSSTCLPLDGGYNKLWDAGVQKTVVELQWQANPERNVVGYEVDNPSGTKVCPTATQDPRSTTCIDFNPPPSNSGTVTYSVSALFSDRNGNTIKGPSKPVSFQGTTSTTTTKQVTNAASYGFVYGANYAGGSNCFAGGASGSLSQEARLNYVGTAFSLWTGPFSFSGAANGTSQIGFCTSTAPAAGSLAVNGASASAMFGTNASSGNATCTVDYSLLRNMDTTTPLAHGTLAMTGGNSHGQNPTYPLSFTNSQAATLAAGDQLTVLFKFLTGNSCGSFYLTYGLNSGTNQPGTLNVTTTSTVTTTTTTGWATPNPPGTVSVVTGGQPGTIRWPDSGTSVNFYRIYRGPAGSTSPMDYTARYETCDTSGCPPPTGVSGMLQYHDPAADGVTLHTYCLTAVGDKNGTATMAESAFSNCVTA